MYFSCALAFSIRRTADTFAFSFAHSHTQIRHPADHTFPSAFQPHPRPLPVSFQSSERGVSFYCTWKFYLKWKSNDKFCISFSHFLTQIRRPADHTFTSAFHRLIPSTRDFAALRRLINVFPHQLRHFLLHLFCLNSSSFCKI